MTFPHRNGWVFCIVPAIFLLADVSLELQLEEVTQALLLDVLVADPESLLVGNRASCGEMRGTKAKKEAGDAGHIHVVKYRQEKLFGGLLCSHRKTALD